MVIYFDGLFKPMRYHSDRENLGLGDEFKVTTEVRTSNWTIAHWSSELTVFQAARRPSWLYELYSQDEHLTAVLA